MDKTTVSITDGAGNVIVPEMDADEFSRRANAVAASFDASGLQQVVERARALLDDGDVAAARMLAGGAYDQAKAAAQFAVRLGAAERLLGKARRLQGDALLIEARAKVRLAAEYDAAQAAGMVGQRTGRPKKDVPEGNDFSAASAEEVGLSRKEIHEARKLADAERRTPGIVERAIAARLAAGLEPSRANLRAAVGTDSATAVERGNNLYETPAEAMRALLALEAFKPTVWEPACGKGAIVRPLEDAGYEVLLSDLVDYGTHSRDGELQHVADFMSFGPHVGNPDIVTNPPYGAALNAFVARALERHRPRKMALLLNLNFLCGFDDPDRCFAMDENKPARIHVFTRRLPMMHRDGWDGNEASSRMNTAWFVWEQDAEGRYAGPTVVNRVDWKGFENAPALAPADPNASTSSRVQSVEAGAAPPPAVPALLVWSQKYANDRIVAKLGDIEVGAVFPDEKGCTWSFWLGTIHGPQKKAKSVDKAKAAIEKLFYERTGLGRAA